MILSRIAISGIFIIFCVSVFGCDNTKTLKSICSETPEFCNDLNQDGWCRKQKADVIRARAAFAEKPNDQQRYYVLSGFHEYRNCIERVTVIEHITKKERKTTRVEGLLTAISEIERLSKETEQSENPFLLLYHWTYNNNTAARDKLLNLEGTQAVAHPEIQQSLASYYSDFDIQRSIAHLKYALSLYSTSKPYPGNMFETMTTMHLKARDYKNAYIWALVAKEMGSKEVQESMIARYQQFSKQEIKLMEKQAEQLVEQIEEYHYSAPAVPAYQ